MRVNIERTLAVGVSQELLNGFDIFSIRLQQGDKGVTGRMPAGLLVKPFAFATGLISRFMGLSGQKGCFPLMVSLAKT